MVTPLGLRVLITRRLLVPIEIRPDIGTALAACLAGELLFEIGQPHIIRPLIGADPDPVRTLVVAIPQALGATGVHSRRRTITQSILS